MNRETKLTNELEIKALSGILYLSGSVKSDRKNVLQMFDSNVLGLKLCI